MKLVFSTFLFFVCSLDGKAQNEVALAAGNEAALCKPGIDNKSKSEGVSLSYSILGNGGLDNINTRRREADFNVRTFQRFAFGVKLPLVNKKGFKLIAGYKFASELYSTQHLVLGTTGISGLGEQLNLKRSTFSVSFAKPLNRNMYLAGQVRTSFHGDYDGMVKFDKRYQSYRGFVTWAKKKDADNEWGVGVAVSKSFNNPRARVLPAVFWNKNFNDKWGMELVIPVKMMLRYNHSANTILLVGGEYKSTSYALEYASDATYQSNLTLSDSHIKAVMTIQQKLAPWVWMSIKGGYQFNLDSELFIQETQNLLVSSKPLDGLYFKIGVFVSPPKKFMK